MKMYKMGGWIDEIEAVEVERFNDKSVWINGRRNARKSSYEKYFETWNLAKAYLIQEISEEVKRCQNQLEYELKRLEKAQNLKNPEL